MKLAKFIFFIAIYIVISVTAKNSNTKKDHTNYQLSMVNVSYKFRKVMIRLCLKDCRKLSIMKKLH